MLISSNNPHKQSGWKTNLAKKGKQLGQTSFWKVVFWDSELLIVISHSFSFISVTILGFSKMIISVKICIDSETCFFIYSKNNTICQYDSSAAEKFQSNSFWVTNCHFDISNMLTANNILSWSSSKYLMRYLSILLVYGMTFPIILC